MPASKLTRALCDAAKSERGRQTAFADSEVRGLELRVSGTGAKSWSFRYRTKLGRQARVRLGVYSREFNVGEARAAARRCLVDVEKGEDPARKARTAKLTAHQEPIKSFGDLAAAYFKATEAGRYRPKRESSLEMERCNYRVHVKPALGKVPIEELSRRMIKLALERIFDCGAPSSALRSQALIRQILTYGVHEERVPYNAARDIPPIAPSIARDRIYSDQQLAAIWSGVQNPQALTLPKAFATKRCGQARVMIGRPMQIIILLAMLLLQRRGEVVGMRKSELDLQHGVWTIPAARMKSKTKHAVPLSAWAIELIREAIDLEVGAETDCVFPSRNDPSKPVGRAAMNYALAGVLWAHGIEDGRVHDLRRTGSTLMTSERLNITPFIRSKVLGHTDTGGGARVSTFHYDANSYLREKRHALARWQSVLARIVGEEREFGDNFTASRLPGMVCGPGRLGLPPAASSAPISTWARPGA